MAAAAIKMDELLVSWLGSDTVFENVQKLMDSYRASSKPEAPPPPLSPKAEKKSPGVIPPFYPKSSDNTHTKRRRMMSMSSSSNAPLDTWLLTEEQQKQNNATTDEGETTPLVSVKDQVEALFAELGEDPPVLSPSSAGSEDDDAAVSAATPQRRFLTLEAFGRMAKQVCRFPSFFTGPLYQRILDLWNARDESVANMDVITMDMFEWFWLQEMEPYDAPERFFRLLKQPENDYIARDDFLPYIKELLNDHPVCKYECLSTVIGFIILTQTSPHVGPRIPFQPRRISRKVRSHCHYSHLLRGQQVSFRSNHVSSSTTFRFTRCFSTS